MAAKSESRHSELPRKRFLEFTLSSQIAGSRGRIAGRYEPGGRRSSDMIVTDKF